MRVCIWIYVFTWDTQRVHSFIFTTCSIIHSLHLLHFSKWTKFAPLHFVFILTKTNGKHNKENHKNRNEFSTTLDRIGQEGADETGSWLGCIWMQRRTIQNKMAFAKPLKCDRQNKSKLTAQQKKKEVHQKLSIRRVGDWWIKRIRYSIAILLCMCKCIHTDLQMSMYVCLYVLATMRSKMQMKPTASRLCH